MSDSSDSDDYSSRVLSKNKKNDETLLATKNNFMKELQNHSNMSHVAQKSFLKANESFVNEIGKRKRESQDEDESDLDIGETNKRKKVHHGGMKDVMEDGPDEFVTIREVAKKKHKKKRLDNFENQHEESERKSKKKNHASLPTELDGFEGGESVPKQGGSPKKHKKSKNRPNDENDMHSLVGESFNLQLEASSSKEEQNKRKNSIITSTQKDRPDSPLNDSILDLLNFEQKKLLIPNIGSQVAEEEMDIVGLTRKSSSSKEKKKSKKDKKVRLESENSQKMDRVKDLDVDDPVHIMKKFQRNNSLQKVDYSESSSLHNLKENCPCFFVKVPVGLDPNQLIGANISLNKKAGIKVGGSAYMSSAGQKETSFVVLGGKTRMRLEVSHLITMKLESKSESFKAPVSTDNEDIINGLLAKQQNIINSPKKPRKTNSEKLPVIMGKKKNIEQLDTFLKDGTKFLEDVKFVSFRFKNEKLVADLDRQTNEVLKKQVEFLQEQSPSAANYGKIRKELADETRDLLQKRTNIMNKVGSDEELSDYF